jgi:hypothetical protein
MMLDLHALVTSQERPTEEMIVALAIRLGQYEGKALDAYQIAKITTLPRTSVLRYLNTMRIRGRISQARIGRRNVYYIKSTSPEIDAFFADAETVVRNAARTLTKMDYTPSLTLGSNSLAGTEIRGGASWGAPFRPASRQSQGQELFGAGVLQGRVIGRASGRGSALEMQGGLADWAKLQGLIEAHRMLIQQLQHAGEMAEIDGALNKILDFKPYSPEARRERAVYLVELMEEGDELQAPQFKRLLRSMI